ncbi:MAG TPA: anti-sigma regulatory factor [Candidatus Baltobacteraceae bacterium]|nr:anti-sigma regulatory factor [Candidatus Baltobacteraceae bacterium]
MTLDETYLPITRDGDVVLARQKGRELAVRLGFSGSDLTLIATAISEIARNIIEYAQTGQIFISSVQHPGKQGIRVVARDAGPGIPDIELAMCDGYSTGKSLGLGLPGARRLMDAFNIESVVGVGTTVTMEKWAS